MHQELDPPDPVTVAEQIVREARDAGKHKVKKLQGVTVWSVRCPRCLGTAAVTKNSFYCKTCGSARFI